jgi:hypothetical protein
MEPRHEARFDFTVLLAANALAGEQYASAG